MYKVHLSLLKQKLPACSSDIQWIYFISYEPDFIAVIAYSLIIYFPGNNS